MELICIEMLFNCSNNNTTNTNKLKFKITVIEYFLYTYHYVKHIT